ncbi:16284_t:CDS:2 [Entrophospora sp. SA101]|nr:7542_t:CDS:2 [Entrophospora candida]CAJ0639668.1 8679_t:CDS:2 [Entrophospora sp. SA101]CAG8543253.1 5317_t:CDS:2 [Entrophospora candida]CAJ0746194.1 16284_t:CDS:2 [Entrophospora sp. SA101]CAJ0842605.1 17280_t:CDS:2 [Entrophospora sp. SA101]
MILLDSHNIVIEETLTQPIVGLEPTILDMTVVDFDGVYYYISTPKSKDVITFSLYMQCYKELVKFGAYDMLKKEYGQYISSEIENNYDFTLEFDLQKLPADKEERVALVKKLSLIKRNLLAQPFERAFEQQTQFEDQKQQNPDPVLMQIHYRDQEAIYIQARHDRVTVIFSTLFNEETDSICGKLFLQEFVDARRRIELQNAPQVLYSNKDPPLEIRHLPELQRLNNKENVGYVTFGDVREKTISQIQLFRDYLHYHIKCAKAYMHSRMRGRVQEFLKVLNRAKPELTTAEKKQKKNL